MLYYARKCTRVQSPASAAGDLALCKGNSPPCSIFAGIYVPNTADACTGAFADNQAYVSPARTSSRAPPPFEPLDRGHPHHLHFLTFIPRKCTPNLQLLTLTDSALPLSGASADRSPYSAPYSALNSPLALECTRGFEGVVGAGVGGPYEDESKETRSEGASSSTNFTTKGQHRRKETPASPLGACVHTCMHGT